VTMLFLTLTVAVGVQYVNKSASVFLAIVIVSIFCFYLGDVLFAAGAYAGDLDSSDRKRFDNMKQSFEKDPDTGITYNFITILALFYPSVTGIMAGAIHSNHSCRSFVHSFSNSFIHSVAHSFIRSFSGSFTRPLIICIVVHAIIHSCRVCSWTLF